MLTLMQKNTQGTLAWLLGKAPYLLEPGNCKTVNIWKLVTQSTGRTNQCWSERRNFNSVSFLSFVSQGLGFFFCIWPDKFPYKFYPEFLSVKELQDYRSERHHIPFSYSEHIWCPGAGRGASALFHHFSSESIAEKHWRKRVTSRESVHLPTWKVNTHQQHLRVI